MPEGAAKMLKEKLKQDPLAVNHTIRMGGSKVVINLKREFRTAPLSEELIQAINTHAKQLVTIAKRVGEGNRRIRFDIRTRNPYSLEIKFREKKKRKIEVM